MATPYPPTTGGFGFDGRVGNFDFNVFFNAANELFAEGKYNVAWAFNYTPNVDSWRQGVVDALMAYSTAGGSWDDVVKAFVDGWAAEWQAQNG